MYLEKPSTSKAGSCAPKRRREISVIWDYFKKSKDSQGTTCNRCGKYYRTAGNTSNLIEHLRRIHPEYLDADKSATTNCLEKFISKDVSYPQDSARKRELDEAVMGMITLDIQPFSIVNDRGFQQLLKKLDPRYKIPSKTHLRNVVLPKQYAAVKLKLMLALNEADNVAITTDCWTSQANEGYLTVTCHYINARFCLKSAVLSTKKLLAATNHSADNIAESLNEIFNDWSISKKIVTIVTDNDVTMKKACETLKIKNFPCAAHTINLLVQEVLKTENVAPLIVKCKKIVAYFKSSTIANEKLKAAQDVEKPYGLIQEVPTCWNSALFMMQRIILINKEISSVLLKLPKAPNPLNAEEIETLTEITELLTPFYEATEQVSANKTATISLVLPTVCELHQKMQLLQSQLKSETATYAISFIQSRLPERFSGYEGRTASRTATILDPRFKKDGFLCASNAEQASKALEQEVCSIIAKNTKPPALLAPPANPLEENQPRKVFTFLQSKLQQKPKTSRSDAIIIMRQYIEKANSAEEQDPLQYWMQNTDSATLGAIAAKYLCIPATSTESERVFSKAGEIISNRRCCLKPKTVDQLVFLNKNIEFQ